MVVPSNAIMCVVRAEERDTAVNKGRIGSFVFDVI